jgi:hypothetical protein
MLEKLPVLAAARIICMFPVLASLFAAGTSAQSKPQDLTITTSGGTFRLAALSSLTDDTAVLSAERVVELALPAAQKEVTTAKTEVDETDGDIATNFKAMEQEKETLAEARRAFQPTVDAYTKDLEALQADDVQFGKDKAPLQVEIDAYNAIPEKDRTDAQYKRLAALKAPFDARWNAMLARKAALAVRYEAMSKVMDEQDQPLIKLQKVDLDLLAQRKAKMAALGEAYRQLQACYLYSTQIKAQLERMKRTPPPTLTPILESASELLKGMSNLGFEAGK